MAPRPRRSPSFAALSFAALSFVALAPQVVPLGRAEAAPEPTPSPAAEEAEAARAKRRELVRLMTLAHDHMQAGRRLLTQAAAEDGSQSAAHARYEEACQAYAQALELLPQVTGAPKDQLELTAQLAHYNTACARARLGQVDPALRALGQALELGYDDLKGVEKDPDLATIREHPRFVNLLERVQARLAKQAMAAAAAELSPGALFPYDFKVTTLAGQELSLKDLRGKVVIVDYWGTWCPPCRMEIPHFVTLGERYKDQLVIVGMTWERGQKGPEVIKQVQAFLAKLGASYPAALIHAQEDLAKVPDLEAFPTTLFLDRQGRVRAREVGYRDLEALEKLVKALVEEGAPAPRDPPPGD